MADLSSELAVNSYNKLLHHYPLIDLRMHPDAECDVVVTIGGDGTMLKAMHTYMHTKTKLYGMNRGAIGFLLNQYQENGLLERLAYATDTVLHPLELLVTHHDGSEDRALAVNEISLTRGSHQAAHIKIIVDDEERMSRLVADGVLLSTPAGSTAYNLAAHGPIIPLDSNMLALTPICPFRPRHWRGALLSQKSCVKFEVISPQKRPVNAAADDKEYKNIAAAEIRQRNDIDITLLSDPNNSFVERILKEQFSN